MQEDSYEGALANAADWREKAETAQSPMLKLALQAVEREYVRSGAEIRSRQVQRVVSLGILGPVAPEQPKQSVTLSMFSFVLRTVPL
jgi:hypothetical protein